MAAMANADRVTIKITATDSANSCWRLGHGVGQKAGFGLANIRGGIGLWFSRGFHRNVQRVFRTKVRAVGQTATLPDVIKPPAAAV